MGSKISKIAVYLPELVLTNEQLVKEFGRGEPGKVEGKLGIRERHIALENETALDLAIHASEKVLVDYDRQKIDMLIFCTQTPDYLLPTTACLLQDKLGLRNNIGAFDYNLGSSGYIYGLAMAKSFINTGIANTVLLITSDTYSKLLHPKDLANRTIFGDGAAATLIESSLNEQIFEFVLGTDGRGKDNLIVPNGGLRNQFKYDAQEKANSAGDIYTDNNLYMNGPEIFNFTINAVPSLFDACLKRNKLTISEIDFAIFHQPNKFMLEYLRNLIGIPKDNFYLNIMNTGNTVSASIPIAYSDAFRNEKIAPGSKVLLCGFGVGYSWGAVVIEV